MELNEPAEQHQMTNKAVADFSLPATGNTTFQLHAHFGKPLVIFFYPKDNTPGCTTENQQFRDLYGQFKKAGCEVVGVSRDSIRTHENFKTKQELPFPLLSDAEETVCEMFGVMKLKNMYGKQVRGIERSTFVLDAAGHIIREWRGLKADGHAQEVLEFVRSIK